MAGRKARAASPKIGRPRVEITKAQWKVIEEMARDQCTHDEMADYLGISKRTFYAPHLKEEFERVTKMSKAKAKWEVRRRQREAALKGHVVSSIWWGKQNLGQTDRQAITDGKGGPLEFASPAIEHLADVLDRLAAKNGEASQ